MWRIFNDGYINIDKYSKANIRSDLRTLPFNDEKIKEIFSSHSLEHFGVFETPVVLKEWYRVLALGGKLILNIPDLESCIKNFWRCQKKKDGDGLFLLSLEIKFMKENSIKLGSQIKE